MHLLFRISFCTYLIIAITSCSFFKKSGKPNPDEVVARAFDNYLVKDDLPQFKGIDSTKLTSAYIDKWMREQVLIRYAKENLSSAREEKLNSEVAKYKNELLVYEYESQLVDLKFKYNPTEEDIKKYYHSYLENFVLSAPVVKLYYLKADKKIKLKDNVLREWMRNPEDNYKLNVVCNEYIMECHLDSSVWVPRKYILDRLRDVNISESNLKGKATFAKLRSSSHNLYLYLIDSREEGQAAPFQYIKKEIEKLLIKKMKSNFVEETKKAMFEKAIKDHEVEIY